VTENRGRQLVGMIKDRQRHTKRKDGKGEETNHQKEEEEKRCFDGTKGNRRFLKKDVVALGGRTFIFFCTVIYI